MHSIVGFISRKWTWAMQNKRFWLGIALWLITAVVIFIFPAPIDARTPSDFRIRVWGMVLQLIGAYTVWRDLTSTADEFGKASVLRDTWKWLKAGYNRKSITLVGANTIGTATCTGGRAWVRQNIDARSSHDERIAALERYVKDIDAEVNRAFVELEKKEQALSETIDLKTSELRQAVDATAARLERAVVGNYRVLHFGAFWLVIGIVLSSVAPELANLTAH